MYSNMQRSTAIVSLRRREHGLPRARLHLPGEPGDGAAADAGGALAGGQAWPLLLCRQPRRRGRHHPDPH